jgi:translation initiation factor 3 subunit A
MSRFRGGPGFARPENALKRADELENVGQKLSALQQLHDVVTNKKHRTWSKTYEEIMFKLLDLCVEMKKRNQAKEALMQYRNMCQQVNINSLEEVIKYYLSKATEKAEEARQQSEVRARVHSGSVCGCGCQHGWCVWLHGLVCACVSGLVWLRPAV